MLDLETFFVAVYTVVDDIYKEVVAPLIGKLFFFQLIAIFIFSPPPGLIFSFSYSYRCSYAKIISIPFF